ncbi:S-adenosylhomocysteine deaminase [Sulfobacillus acidophilus DSM 10332]|uniref:S-adenosylhomocysteine deaminase n=1 Tax=Sulfobacillus acidophilus (strain ATCC 700253 / DSM 10332 / NAL) TaxID=679936 RepID=G8TUQ3_SULAD|nr:S-adenosylhomocysteine deaminase [Sulfobacillus acidophilus DSM 10332]
MRTRIKNAWVVTMNAQRDVLPATDIWVEDDRIVGIGRYSLPADHVIDATGYVAMPGLIQPHIHLCQTLFRGAADDLRLLDWLQQKIWPLESALDASAMRAAADLGLAELIQSGTTTILDMGSVAHTDQIFEAVQASGLRAWAGKCLMDRPNPWLQESRHDAIHESRTLIERWHGADNGRIQYALAPRFTLSVTDALWEETLELALATGVVIHTHASETLDEVDEAKRLHVLAPLAHLNALDVTRAHVVAAHGVWLTDEELAIAEEKRVGLAHCPSSNLKLGSGIAPVPRWLQAGLTFGIAADGAPCNNWLDGFTEMRMASLLAKPAFGAQAFPAEEVLAKATIGGAEVLGAQHTIGSLEVGKQADLILVDIQGLHHTPDAVASIYSQLVYQTRATDVHLTMVAGRILYHDGQFFTMNPESVRANARSALKRTVEKAYDKGFV